MPDVLSVVEAYHRVGVVSTDYSVQPLDETISDFFNDPFSRLDQVICIVQAQRVVIAGG